MADEPERDDRATADQGRVLDEILTPDARKKLGDVALLSEKQVEHSDDFSKASPMLAAMVGRYPEFEAASREFLAKMAHLRDFHGELARQVMRHSHL